MYLIRALSRLNPGALSKALRAHATFLAGRMQSASWCLSVVAVVICFMLSTRLCRARTFMLNSHVYHPINNLSVPSSTQSIFTRCTGACRGLTAPPLVTRCPPPARYLFFSAPPRLPPVRIDTFLLLVWVRPGLTGVRSIRVRSVFEQDLYLYRLPPRGAVCTEACPPPRHQPATLIWLARGALPCF